jgi:hypothetical protein
MPPPSEWPTIVARSWPSATIRSRMSDASAPSEASARGLSERAVAEQVRRDDREALRKLGQHGSQLAEEFVMPWISSEMVRVRPCGS